MTGCRRSQLEACSSELSVDRATGRTDNVKYFDCVNGAREVVDAVADQQTRLSRLAEGAPMTGCRRSQLEACSSELSPHV